MVKKFGFQTAKNASFTRVTSLGANKKVIERMKINEKNETLIIS